MTLLEFQTQAARTCPKLAPTPKSLTDNLHMTMGMVTEVGELVDVFKKAMAYGKPIDWVNVEEEWADTLWYMVNFARINNLDMEKAMTSNIQKLKVRFPDKFSGEQAINRDTTKERVELEK